MIEVEAPDGTIIEFPDGTAPDVMKAAMAKRFAAPKPEGGGLVKKAGAFLGGMQDRAFETVGGLVDLSAKATNALGLTNIPKGYNTQAIKDGWNSASRAMGADPESFTPQTAGEKFLHGAGGGVFDAATMATGAGAVAGASRAGGVTNRVAAALAAQPAMQAAAGGVGQGVGEATDNPYLGIAASMAVPAAASAAGRVITPIRSQLDPQRQRLAQALMDEGVDLTAGQRTGSRALQGIESVFPNLPFTGRAAAEQAGNQQRQFNRAVLARAGIDADNASPEVIDQAFTRLGGEFTRLSNGTTLDLGDDFQRALGEVVARYSRKLPSQTREVFQNYVDDIAGLNGQMPGTTYQVTRSDLTKQAKAAANSDPTFSEALRGLRNALDDAAERSIAPENRGAWQNARRQYANLKTISKAATGGGQAGAAGDIAPAQLYSATKQGAGTDQFARGRGDMNQLARAGQAFLRPSIPNSGTAERTFWQNMMTGSAPGATAGALMGGAPGAAVGAVASLAGPRIAQMAYNSPMMQRYLTNQAFMPDGISPRLIAALLATEGERQIIGP